MKRIDKLIYLAGPYSHRLTRIRQRRNDQLTEVSARLFEKGVLNYSPITHSHAQQAYLSNNDTGFDHWRRNDLAYVSRCDEVWVLTLDGWDQSYGVAEEIKFADSNNIPVKYLHISGDRLYISNNPNSELTIL